jgi:hypothetical protein
MYKEDINLPPWERYKKGDAGSGINRNNTGSPGKAGLIRYRYFTGGASTAFFSVGCV